MATNLLLVLILMASIITAAHSRSTLHLSNSFHRHSAAFNGHAIRLSQTGNSNGFNQQDSASIPTGVGDGGFTAAPTLVSSVEQRYIPKAIVVTVIVALISSVTIAVLRTICNRYRSIGTDEGNGPGSTGEGSVGPERPNDVENESQLNGIESVGPERPTYEPRPIPETVVNYELTIFSCNFPLWGVPL